MIVKSLNGTGYNYPKPKCGCSDWIDHWENNMNSATKCYACGKKNTKLVGGHVKKCNSNDNSFYIIPLCSSCNDKDPFEFECPSSDLVPAAREKCIKVMFDI